MRVICSAATDPGLKRLQNEDCFRADPALRLFLVADGVGGQTAGQVASQTAADAVERFIRETSDDPHKTWPVGLDLALSYAANRLRAAILLANRALSSHIAADQALKGMAATLSAALFDGDEVVVSNVGDCRAYLVRDSQMVQLTRDHSWVAEQVRAGHMDIATARAHPLRHVVTRAIAGTISLDVDVIPFKWVPGDRILLCSDGLSGVVPDDEILAEVAGEADVERACHRLIGRARALGGPDNITAVLIQVVAGDS